MKAEKIWKLLSVLYIIYYVCSLVLLLLIVFNKVPFTMMAVEWWQTLFLPIVAPLIFFFTSVEVLEPVPMLILGRARCPWTLRSLQSGEIFVPIMVKILLVEASKLCGNPKGLHIFFAEKRDII